MSVPSRLVLQDAMRAWRKNVRADDDQLRQAEPARTADNAPIAYSGAAATVYQLICSDGTRRAVRIFTQPPVPDIAERYARIGPYLQQHLPDAAVRFSYHERGLRYVAGQKVLTAPLLEMDWIEGERLSAYVGRLALAGRRDELADLCDRCVDLFARMRAASIAHSDLAGSNLIVLPDGSLKLIDYDGVFVPDLAGRRVNNYGQRPYQHRGVEQRSFDASMDDYARLVIVTAIAALAHQPALWQQHMPTQDTGFESDRLLFDESCHHTPAHSPVFQALRTLDDDTVRLLSEALQRAAEGPLHAVSLPPEAIDPALRRLRRQLARLEQLLAADDSAALLAFDHQALAGFPPALPLLDQLSARVALTHLRTALAARDDERAAQLLPAVEQGRPPLSSADRSAIKAFKQREKVRAEFDRRLAQSNDSALLSWLSRSTTWRNVGPAETVLRPAQLIQRQQLYARQSARQQLNAALAGDDDATILAAWDAALALSAVTADTAPPRVTFARQRTDFRTDFAVLSAQGDDRLLLSWLTAALAALALDDAAQVLNVAQLALIDQAQARDDACQQLDAALAGDDDATIIAAWDAALALSAVTADTAPPRVTFARRRARLREEFAAFTDFDDAELLAWLEDAVIQLALDDAAQLLNEEQLVRVARARRRESARQRLRSALAAADVRELVAAADELQRIGVPPASVADHAEEAVAAARATLELLADLQARLALPLAEQDLAAICAQAAQQPQVVALLDDESTARLQEAQQEAADLARLETLLGNHDERTAVQVLRRRPGLAARLDAGLSAAAERAQARVAHAQALRSALDTADLCAVARVYQPALLRVWVPMFLRDLPLLAMAVPLYQAMQQLEAVLNTRRDRDVESAVARVAALLPGGEAQLPADLRTALRTARRRNAIAETVYDIWNRQSVVDAARLLRSESAWLPDYPYLRDEERAFLTRVQVLAGLRDQAAVALRDGRDGEALRLVEQIDDDAYRATLGVTRLQLARQRVQQVLSLAQVLTDSHGPDREQRLARACPPSLARHPALPPAMRERVELARRRVLMAARVRDTLRRNAPPDEVAAVYDAELDADESGLFTPDERRRIRTALSPQLIEPHRAGGAPLNPAAATNSAAPGLAPTLEQMLQLAELKVDQLMFEHSGPREVIVSWCWPDQPVVQTLLVLLRSGAPPPRPELARSIAAVDVVPVQRVVSNSRDAQRIWVTLPEPPAPLYVSLVVAMRRAGADDNDPAAWLYGRQMVNLVIPREEPHRERAAQ